MLELAHVKRFFQNGEKGERKKEKRGGGGALGLITMLKHGVNEMILVDMTALKRGMCLAWVFMEVGVRRN